MKDFQEKVLQEKKGLEARIKEMLDFKWSDKYSTIPAEDQVLMSTQLDMMKAYSNILDLRIKSF